MSNHSNISVRLENVNNQLREAAKKFFFKGPGHKEGGSMAFEKKKFLSGRATKKELFLRLPLGVLNYKHVGATCLLFLQNAQFLLRWIYPVSS